MKIGSYSKKPLIVFLLGSLLVLFAFVPKARADDDNDSGSDDKETAEELEKAAKKAMQEARKMLERAKARREAEKKLKGEGTSPGEAAKGEFSGQPAEPAVVNIDKNNNEQVILSPREEREARRRAARQERLKRRAMIRARRAAIRAKRGRPAFYLNWMITGAVLGEDEGNKFTDRKSNALAGIGLTFRGGAIIDNRHMIGGRLQTFIHLTKAILDKYEPDYKLGSIFQITMGPEYRYRTPFNLTFGFCLGLGITAIDNDINGSNSSEPDVDIWIGDEHYNESDNNRSVVSLAALAELGYEFRFGYWFGLQLELFGGLYHGFDNDARQVNNLIIGTSVGIGF
ncbi:MAG: hypothetical protein GXP49_07365 [Deltaproteobacteria bacterium]|nr:hypothetical protein [Deltaproteobacteria bacterium]